MLMIGIINLSLNAANLSGGSVTLSLSDFGIFPIRDETEGIYPEEIYSLNEFETKNLMAFHKTNSR